MFEFYIFNYHISLPKSWFHCQSETNHIVNENFSFPKQIGPFQKRQLIKNRGGNVCSHSNMLMPNKTRRKRKKNVIFFIELN